MPMPQPPTPSPELATIYEAMESFEASGSIANTGTGSRREGEDFEKLLGRMWAAFRDLAVSAGARLNHATGPAGRAYAQLSVGDRCLFVPSAHASPSRTSEAPEERWLEVTFKVSELLAAFPSEPDVVSRYAPGQGPFAGPAYPGIYSGLSTRFDDTVVLAANGVLREKILLEYKTAKSSSGRQIDGNAHERLSFQVMQYLEVATRYTKCSLAVLANGAFVRYRNKYHVNFHVQADRLSNFAWFSMDHMCTAPEYSRFHEGLLLWLFTGSPRTTNSPQ